MVAARRSRERRLLGRAPGRGDRAPRVEAAAAGRVQRARRLAAHVVAGGEAVLIQQRRRDQHPSVGMQGVVEHLITVPDLDDPAEVHDGDAIADMAHDPQIVRDQQQRETEAALQIDEQVDDLRAQRRIEGRRRLVAHQEPGLEQQRARDDDALKLAAGALSRQALDEGIVESDLPQHVGHAPKPLLVRSDAMLRERRREARPDPHAGIERRERVLEDELHRGAKPPELLPVQRREVPARDGDGAAVRRQQSQQHPGERALAAAGFPDETHHLASANSEADSVERAHAPFPPRPHSYGKVLHDPVGDHEVRRRPGAVFRHLALHAGHGARPSIGATAQHRTAPPSGCSSRAGSRLRHRDSTGSRVAAGHRA